MAYVVMAGLVSLVETMPAVCVEMCANRWVGTCASMLAGKCVNMCVHMCEGLSEHGRRHVCWQVC